MQAVGTREAQAGAVAEALWQPRSSFQPCTSLGLGLATIPHWQHSPQVPAFGVTFEPGCRNNWHVHHAETGSGQIFICTGYYQEWGKPAIEMTPGVTVNIPAGVKHWHGAAPDAWLQHIALEVPGTGGRNEWLEPVDDTAYAEITKIRYSCPASTGSCRE